MSAKARKEGGIDGRGPRPQRFFSLSPSLSLPLSLPLFLFSLSLSLSISSLYSRDELAVEKCFLA